MTNIPENLIQTLNNNNIHTVILPNQDYSQAFEDIAEAFDDIVDDIKNNYFKTPTKKELKKTWIDSGLQNKQPYDEELCTHIYYRYCVHKELQNNANKFLTWLSSQSRFFTYIRLELNQSNQFIDIIEYHPTTNLRNTLLDNLDKK